jgi:hypothetical protein
MARTDGRLAGCLVVVVILAVILLRLIFEYFQTSHEARCSNLNRQAFIACNTRGPRTR